MELNSHYGSLLGHFLLLVSFTGHGGKISHHVAEVGISFQLVKHQCTIQFNTMFSICRFVNEDFLWGTDRDRLMSPHGLKPKRVIPDSHLWWLSLSEAWKIWSGKLPTTGDHGVLKLMHSPKKYLLHSEYTAIWLLGVKESLLASKELSWKSVKLAICRTTRGFRLQLSSWFQLPLINFGTRIFQSNLPRIYRKPQQVTFVGFLLQMNDFSCITPSTLQVIFSTVLRRRMRYMSA